MYHKKHHNGAPQLFASISFPRHAFYRMNFIKRGINQDVFSIRIASLGLSPAGAFKSFRGAAQNFWPHPLDERKVFGRRDERGMV
jgi:hypothetical protein